MEQWIDFRETTPKKYEVVLCYQGDFIGNNMGIYRYMGEDNWRDSRGCYTRTKSEGITHWTKLPPKPSEFNNNQYVYEEKNETVIKIPYKTGDKLYDIRQNNVQHRNNNKVHVLTIQGVDVKLVPWETWIAQDIHLEDIGVTVFTDKEEAEKHLRRMEEYVIKQKAIYTGFSQHDCEAYYKCPYCNKSFGSWSVFHNVLNENGTKKYCPHCKEELDGLE